MLQPGNYLAYTVCSPDDLDVVCQLDILSLAGEYHGSLTDKVKLSGRVSPNGKLIVFSNEGKLRIINLETGKHLPFRAASDYNCFEPDWGPDENNIVASCDGEIGEDIYLFSLAEDTSVRLTDCEESEDYCQNPVWSPTGKWIAFYRTSTKSGVSETRGLYLIDTACFDNYPTCSNSDRGPHGVFRPRSWSPDGIYLAGQDANIIHIVMMKDGIVSSIQDIEAGDRLVESLAWSPDGRWIAYSSNSQIYLISVGDWTLSQLRDIRNRPEINGWIIISTQDE